MPKRTVGRLAVCLNVRHSLRANATERVKEVIMGLLDDILANVVGPMLAGGRTTQAVGGRTTQAADPLSPDYS